MADSRSRPAGDDAVTHRRQRRPPLLGEANALFLDIDGTLLHLADTPQQVRIDPGLLVLLPALLERLGGAVALITGRSIADAQRLFPGLLLPIAGQHGCERRAHDGSVHKHPAVLTGLHQMRRNLAEFARRHPGLIFEDKGSTLAIHYRRTPGLAGLVHRTLRAQIIELPDGAWTLQPGKCVLELRPHGRDKGTAILEYLREPPFRHRIPVFVGDDLTDEYGFSAVATRGGWAVKVGRGATLARYRLPEVTSVREWLSKSVAGADFKQNPRVDRRRGAARFPRRQD